MEKLEVPCGAGGVRYGVPGVNAAKEERMATIQITERSTARAVGLPKVGPFQVCASCCALVDMGHANRQGQVYGPVVFCRDCAEPLYRDDPAAGYLDLGGEA
jgi:hypothetical protein